MRRIIIAAGLTLAGTFAMAQQANVFPEGPGRDIVAVACTQCHAPQPFTQLRMGETGWRKQVENMVLRGAMIAPNELDVVTKYLTTAYGPGVPLPNAPAKSTVSLATGPGANLVEGACGVCHGLDRVVAANRPGQQWTAIVHRMAEIGAQLDAEQSRQIISYLEQHYGATRP